VMKSLERDPDRRYQTAEEMGEDLRRFLVEDGICTTSTTIRRFVEDRFGERQDARKKMERTASTIRSPGRIESLPGGKIPTAILSSHQPSSEPIDDPHMARRIVEIARPVGIATADFDAQPATEITALPKARARARPATLTAAKKKPSPFIGVLGTILGAVVVVALVAAIWPEVDSEEQDEETVEVWEESSDSLLSGSVSVSDMGGDGGKKGTVAFYFRVIPASAKIEVNGEKRESDLVVPESRSRYTIRFSQDGFRPQVVTVTAEASRLIEASLEQLPKVKKRSRRRRR
jgi:hypothetical protein